LLGFIIEEKLMGYLRDKRVYLSGAIEFGDKGHNWRTEPIKAMTNDFGMNVFDPFSDPKQQWTEDLDAARSNKDYLKIRKIAKNFVRKDLCMVDRSDFLVAYMPYKVPTTGTVHEIVVSNEAKKPTLIVCPQGKENAPIWLWGVLPENYFFGSWDDLYKYLVEVDAGLHTEDDRWHFCCGLI
jgi:nucleoside 2-deoxyribosyltransferase